jgi:imidazolonepropionase-like amidohydrolase
VFVPTRFIVEALLAMKGVVPEYAYWKLAALADSHMQAIRIAIDRGVKMATGTDIFVTGPTYWGRTASKRRCS